MKDSIIGKKFNSLTIIEISRSPDKVIAICECGTQKEFYLSNIKANRTKSCGCQNRKASSSRFRNFNKARISKFTPKLSESHNLSTHPIYSVWLAMNKRCYDVNDISYCRYGGKGVFVCDEWRNDFMAFYNWALANGWQPGLQLDKDIRGNGKLYSPETCTFVTRKENCRNRTTNRLIDYNGQTKTLAEWSEITGLKHTCILHRLSRGWDIKKTFSTPAKYNGYHANAR